MNRFGMSVYEHPAVQEAIRILRDGEPLPVDVYIELNEVVGQTEAENIINTYGE